LRDPGDDYLVALALAANADAIVTGDKDLLDHPGLQPPAINARQACELLGLTEPR
jgi:predicted nucleic acid-binding protein